MFDVICPYCKHQFDVCEDDGMHCEQNAYEEESCPECEKEMMVSTTWYASRNAFKADCLNKDNPAMSDHAFSEHTTVKFINDALVFGKMQKCQACKLVIQEKAND